MRLERHHLNAAIYLGVSVLTKGASTLLLIPVYTRHLDRADYGANGLCQTLYSIVAPLISLALVAAFARFYFDHRDPAERARTLGAIARALVVLCLGAGLVGEIILDLVPGVHLGELPARYLRLVLWSCACIPIADMATCYLRASQSAGRFAALNLSVFVLTAGSTLYFLLVRHSGLIGILSGMLIGQVAAALVSLAFVFTQLDPMAPGRGQIVRDALRYGIPLIPHLIGNALLVGADRWALEYYGLREDLGLYTLATQLTLPILLVASAWNEAASPRFHNLWRDQGDAAARAAFPRLLGGFLAITLLALGAVLVALPIFRYLVGARFVAAFPLVPWTGLGLVIGCCFSAFVAVLEWRKATRLIPLLTLSAVGVNIALNFLLVPRWGVYGAIAGTGLAYLFRFLVLGVFAWRALYAR